MAKRGQVASGDNAIRRAMDPARREATRTAEAKVKAAGPGYGGRRLLVEDDVDDPYGVHERIKVVRNAGHDPIEQLYHQKRRDGTRMIGQGERQAGHEVRRLVEASGLNAVRAILYEAIRVDGGGRQEDLPASRIDAGFRLRRLATRLGPDQFEILVRVAGYGETITLVARDFEDDPDGAINGGCSARTRDRVGWALRRALRNAADNLGYGKAVGPSRGRIRGDRDGARPEIGDVEESARLVSEAQSAIAERKMRRADRKAKAKGRTVDTHDKGS